MKRLSKRQRLLAGALLVAGAIAAIDRFTGGGPPAPARAREATEAAPPAAPAGWNDVNALVAKLTQSDYASVADELEQLERDVFVPTSSARAAFVANDPAPAEPTEPPAAERQAGFLERHNLSGVVLGETPLAVVDEQLLSLFAQVDGFMLVQIERDYVVFQELGTDTRLVLELAARPKNQ
jgi:hypothetical protein